MVLAETQMSPTIRIRRTLPLIIGFLIGHWLGMIFWESLPLKRRISVELRGSNPANQVYRVGPWEWR